MTWDRVAGARWLLALALVTSSGLAGCVGSQQTARAVADERGCVDSSGVQNQPDNFQYGGATACKTGEESYDWENPSPSAKIQFGSSIAKGEIGIVIQDAAGRTVYEGTSGPGSQGGQTSSDLGVPSNGAQTWTIELSFRNVTGTLGLQISSSQ